MKIILKYILTNIWEHKTRTVVMLMSIALSTMLLFVSLCVGVSYESAQKKMACGMAGDATVSVRAKNRTISIEEIPDLACIEAKVGILESTALYCENGYYESIDLISSDLHALAQINKPRLLDQKEITNFSGSKIILPYRFTSKYRVAKGDKITLEVNDKTLSLNVSEIAAYDTVFLRHTRGTTALLPYDYLANLLGTENGYTEILIKPEKDTSTSELIHNLKKKLSDQQYEVSAIVNESKITSDARQKSMPFFLISFFSLTMSVFIIYSSYQVITLERLPIIGTFRSIGATQKKVSHILLTESVFYGCIGGLLGIPVGFITLKFILHGIGSSLSQGIEIPVIISVPGFFFSLSVAILVSLLSAWIPVRRASQIPIKDVILGTVEIKQIPRPIIASIGIVIFLLSILLPNWFSGNLLYLAGGFSLLGLITSTILLIPLLTNLSSAGLEHLYGVLFHNEGRLAARNMRNNKNTVQNITLLFISVSAIIAIHVVGSFVTTYISDVFHNAELQGFADGKMNQEFVEQVEDMDGIQKILPIYVFKNNISGNDFTFSRTEATENLEMYCSMLALHYTEVSMEKASNDAFRSGKRSIILNEDCINRTGIAVGDTISLSNNTTNEFYVVTGSFKSRATDVEAVISSDYAVSDFGATTFGFLAYTADNPEAIMVQIRNLFGTTSNWSLTVKEFNEDARSTVGAFLKPMQTMTYFILLLATVGVMNNLLINYIQKRHITAMYRSVGLSIRQNIKIILIEGFSSGLIGAFTAILISYLEIKTIFLVAGPKISMQPELDITTFLVAGLLGIVINLAGSIVPICKSNKMKLVEELKYE